MKYLFDVEKPGSTSFRFINLAASCALAAGCTGVIIAVFGYAPKPDLLLMMPAGFMLGGTAGGLIGLCLCYVLFRHSLTNRIFQTVAVVASVAGAAGAIVFRVLTNDQGGWLGAYPSIAATIVAAVWFRFSKPRADGRNSLARHG